MEPLYYNLLRQIGNRGGLMPATLQGEEIGEYNHRTLAKPDVLAYLRERPLYFSTHEVLVEIKDGLTMDEVYTSLYDNPAVFEVEYPAGYGNSSSNGRGRTILMVTHAEPNDPASPWGLAVCAFYTWIGWPVWYSAPFHMIIDAPTSERDRYEHSFAIPMELHTKQGQAIKQLIDTKYNQFLGTMGTILYAVQREPRIVIRQSVTMPNSGPKAVRKARPMVDREYRLVVLRSEIKKYERRDWQGGTHASPVEHERAAHTRVIHKGTDKERVVYVRGCTVNPGKKLPIAYRIDP